MNSKRQGWVRKNHKIEINLLEIFLSDESCSLQEIIRKFGVDKKMRNEKYLCE